MKKFILIVLLLSPLRAVAQGVTVTPFMGVGHVQFDSMTGTPLAGGKVFFYQAGTTTPANTYIDSTGTTLNSSPIILDAGGFATVYLAAIVYKLCVQDLNGVQQWCQDQISPFQSLSAGANLILSGVTSDPIGASAGELGYRTDLGRFRGFNSAWDSLIFANSIDTLTNKTLSAPSIVNPSSSGTDNGTETLNNKTLASPAISSPAFSGTATGTANFLPVTLFNSGTGASNTTFWRGDGTWAAPPAAVTEATMTTGNNTFVGSSTFTCKTGASQSTPCLYYFFANAHTLTRIIVSVSQAPVGCGTAPVVGVRDITASSNVSTISSFSTGIVDSGALSASMTAGHQFGIGLITTDSGCGTDLSVIGVTATYQ